MDGVHSFTVALAKEVTPVTPRRPQRTFSDEPWEDLVEPTKEEEFTVLPLYDAAASPERLNAHD